MSHETFFRRIAVGVAALVVALSSRTLSAQTGVVQGKVTDAATSQPISEARVVVTGTPFGAQTTKDGDYRLTNVRPGKAVISIFRLGYKATVDSVDVVAGQTATLNVAMVQSAINLSEVVVTGTAGN